MSRLTTLHTCDLCGLVCRDRLPDGTIRHRYCDVRQSLPRPRAARPEVVKNALAAARARLAGERPPES